MVGISRSLWRKLTATAAVAAGFVLMYEAKVIDFRQIAVPSQAKEVVSGDEPVGPNANHLRFAATAYCKGTTTASGVNVRTGIAAADPDLLPVGSVIQVYRLGERYNGIYTIMDTGPAVQGREIDIYMWSCHEALQFGRRQIAINVLRLGWNPKASSPTLIERLFRQREAAILSEPAAPLASRPIEIR
ncbi:MAG TPA: 3D domain-containing protein [Vicinamibacterales bacterium]|nr:3D domain-containing protein [Vicinamibacterales bacterium]